MEETHSIAEVAASMGASPRWVTEQIRSGRFRARKIGRAWRMTDSDVAAALEDCANHRPRPCAEVATIPTGLTRRSRRRVVGQ